MATLIQDEIEQLQRTFEAELQGALTAQDLEVLKVKYLGKKGPIQQLMPKLKEVSSEEKPHFGMLINNLKESVTQAIDECFQSAKDREIAEKLKSEKIDISLPGRHHFLGRRHPLTEAKERVIDILTSMGFSVHYGPDIDSDYYNFEALNFAEDHPARDMQDTFYIDNKLLLRTHTSNIQARIMEANAPPIRIIAPGKVYRNETITQRSHVFFHQVEGLYIDKDVTFSDLLGTMDLFLKKLFGSAVSVRYRPSYFPFVEPGLEVDISCIACAGSGCGLCKQTGWLEILGAGMVHPEVLKNGGIDSEVYSGYAWGMGIERTCMLLTGVKDIRQFTENDLRFLAQF